MEIARNYRIFFLRISGKKEKSSPLQIQTQKTVVAIESGSLRTDTPQVVVPKKSDLSELLFRIKIKLIELSKLNR